MRVLLVEDNRRLAGFVVEGLRGGGFTVDAFETGEDAKAALATVRYDAVVLDLGLPDIDGMKLLAEIRRGRNSIPVLVLTARDGIGDRVAGLNAGADDYVLKPFAMEELVARLRALLRRPSEALDATLAVGNVELDTVAREFRVDQRCVPLSRRELGLLEQLMRRQGRVVSRGSIDERVYGMDDEVSSNSIEVIVSRLRKSLRLAKARVQILTFRGIGYMLCEEPQ